MSMYKHNFAEIQWRSWSTLDLSLMLISAMQHSPIPAAQFSLVFHYFDGNSPLLSFLKFHEEFVLRNDFEGSKKHLQDFQLCMDKVCSCDQCPCLCVISYGMPNATKIIAKNDRSQQLEYGRDRSLKLELTLRLELRDRDCSLQLELRDQDRERSLPNLSCR